MIYFFKFQIFEILLINVVKFFRIYCLEFMILDIRIVLVYCVKSNDLIL